MFCLWEKYTAGSHHLRLIQNSFGKDDHGLREKDLNHKDRQNYEDVLRKTSRSVQNLLATFHDSKGTAAYVDIIRLVIDSF